MSAVIRWSHSEQNRAASTSTGISTTGLGFELAKERRAEIGMYALQRADHGGEEGEWVVVEDVELVPGCYLAAVVESGGLVVVLP